MLKLLLPSMAVVVLTSCASVATVIGCGTQIPDIPDIKEAKLDMSVTVETDSGRPLTERRVVLCKYESMSCGGGDWRPNWLESSPKQDMKFDIGGGRIVTAELPSCGQMLYWRERFRDSSPLHESFSFWMRPLAKGDMMLGDRTGSEFKSKYGFKVVDAKIVVFRVR